MESAYSGTVCTVVWCTVESSVAQKRMPHLTWWDKYSSQPASMYNMWVFDWNLKNEKNLRSSVALVMIHVGSRWRGSGSMLNMTRLGNSYNNYKCNNHISSEQGTKTNKLWHWFEMCKFNVYFTTINTECVVYSSVTIFNWHFAHVTNKCTWSVSTALWHTM